VTSKLNNFIFSIDNLLGKYRKRLKRENALSKFKSVGKNFDFDPYSTFIRHHTIAIGENVYIGPNSYISSEGVCIKNNVMIGPGLIIQGNDHIYNQVGMLMKQIKEKVCKEVNIDDDVWIGARVTILKGVTIREGSVIGTGSVVTRSIPPYTIAVGIPCKPLKKRFSDSELLKHLTTIGRSEVEILKIIIERNLYFK